MDKRILIETERSKAKISEAYISDENPKGVETSGLSTREIFEKVKADRFVSDLMSVPNINFLFFLSYTRIHSYYVTYLTYHNINDNVTRV